MNQKAIAVGAEFRPHPVPSDVGPGQGHEITTQSDPGDETKPVTDSTPGHEAYGALREELRKGALFQPAGVRTPIRKEAGREHVPGHGYPDSEIEHIKDVLRKGALAVHTMYEHHPGFLKRVADFVDRCILPSADPADVRLRELTGRLAEFRDEHRKDVAEVNARIVETNRRIDSMQLAVKKPAPAGTEKEAQDETETKEPNTRRPRRTGAGRPVTVEERNEVTKLRANGLKIPEIAEITGRSVTTVGRIVLAAENGK